MAFKKISNSPSEELVETKVIARNGEVLAKWKVLKRNFPFVLKILNEKFDFGLKFKTKEKEKKDRDLEWMK